MVPLTDCLAPATLLGVLLCFRHVVPNVGEADEREQTMKGSFGEKTPASGEKGSVSEMVDQSKLVKVRIYYIHGVQTLKFREAIR